MYHNFSKYINKENINIIFELGTRDLDDAIKLINTYNKSICYSFECNPDCLEECKKRISNFNEEQKNRIILVKHAVSLETGKVPFFPFDLHKYNNMGASSMLEIDFSLRNKNDPDYNIGKVQKEIIVDGIRLDEYMKQNNIDKIDLLCIDLQGYELKAIQSLGEKIKSIKYIITECSIQTTYKNGTNFRELNNYLESHGFKYRVSNDYGEKYPDLNKIGFTEFDVLYVNAFL